MRLATTVITVLSGSQFGPELISSGIVAADFTDTSNVTVEDESAGVIRLTNDAGGSNHAVIPTISALVVGQTYRLSGELFVPSANTTDNAARFGFNGSAVVAGEDDWFPMTDPGYRDFVYAVFVPPIPQIQVASGGAWGAAGDYCLVRNMSVRLKQA